MNVVGRSLAHGLAHRYGRDGWAEIQTSLRRVRSCKSQKTGKQSRMATYRRMRQTVFDLVGAERVLLRLEQGQKKAAVSLDYCALPQEDGGQLVLIVRLAAKTLYLDVVPLLFFGRHGVAGLMQATKTQRPIDALQSIKALLVEVTLYPLHLEDFHHLIIIDPGAGWMPTCRNPETGVPEVVTVISEAALSPWRKAAFDRCVAEGHWILVDTRPAHEIQGDIGSDVRSLACVTLGPAGAPPSSHSKL